MRDATSNSRDVVPAACGRARFSSFDELSSLSPGWEEEAVQLGRGRANVEVSYAATGRLVLACFDRAPGVKVRGAAGPGTAILGALLSGGRASVQGQDAPVGRFMIIPAGFEFEFLCSEPHRILIAAIDARLLDEVWTARWGYPLPRNRALTTLRESSAGSAAIVTAGWMRRLDRAVVDPGLALDAANLDLLGREALGAAVTATELEAAPPAVRPWRTLALRAERHLRETLEEHPGLTEVCSAVGTSSRSLHASFVATFGMTPKAYQKMLRLHAARRDIVAAKPGTSVSQVATRWGFQVGYFARDYRLTYDELPSQTLRRVLSRKTGPSVTV